MRVAKNPIPYFFISLGLHLSLLFFLSLNKKKKPVKAIQPPEEAIQVRFENVPIIEEEPIEQVIKPLPKPTPTPKIVKSKKKIEKKIKKDFVKRKFSARKRKNLVKAPKKVVRKHSRPVNPQKLKKVRATYVQQLKRFLEKNKKYPRQARRLRHKGIVTVKMVIHKNGQFSNIRLIGPSKFKSLNSATLSFLKSLGKFKPLPTKYMNGEEFIIPISYKL